MHPRNKFWLFAILSITATFSVVVIIFILFWRELGFQERDFLLSILQKNMGYFFIAGILLLAGIGFALDAIFLSYILPLSKLAEETALIQTANPSHRINLEGAEDIRRLCLSINEIAVRYEEQQKDVREKIRNALTQAEEEKDILAAFMSELAQGILICNTNGHILLYNRRAKQLLSNEREEATPLKAEMSGRFVGLGRSVYELVDANLIRHALDEIQEKLDDEDSDSVSHFVYVNREGVTLRVEAVPIVDQNRSFSGFILIFHDITRQLETEGRVDFLLQSLVQGIRSSLAGVRSAIEAILEYPEMGEKHRSKFHQIIHAETISLSDLLKRTSSEYSRYVMTQWPLVPMIDRDLIDIVRRKARERFDIQVRINNFGENDWIRVDGYSIVLASLFLLRQLSVESGKFHFTCMLKRNERFVNYDILWEGEPLRTEKLRSWKEKPLILENEGIPLTLREILRHNSAEVWSFTCKDSGKPYLRISLPIVSNSVTEPRRNKAILPGSRTEFYDFDLFHQAGQTPELDECPISELIFTVFDTETTGLNPKGGDEIISIGAVRIVNNHLLPEEKFDRLINPQRSVPAESTRVHGIRQEMLENQPTIDVVLPLFHQFANGTILIGHNAAFDMRMLELKEKATGVKFINPVLDTMLLSSVVHPAHEHHSIEALAERLGVRIHGRHTALGDAFVTAKLFLKLIPLLEKQGIRTLKQARQASEKTYYARLKY